MSVPPVFVTVNLAWAPVRQSVALKVKEVGATESAAGSGVAVGEEVAVPAGGGVGEPLGASVGMGECDVVVATTVLLAPAVVAAVLLAPAAVAVPPAEAFDEDLEEAFEDALALEDVNGETTMDSGFWWPRP
jgi:hypothetical protein